MDIYHTKKQAENIPRPCSYLLLKTLFYMYFISQCTSVSYLESDRRRATVRFFLSFPRAGNVCNIKLSHMFKNNRNRDLVWEKEALSYLAR